MKVIMKTINLYKFSELSDESKETAISELYDINVDCEWYGYIYEDAAHIGIKITGFDIGRASYCNGDFIKSPEHTANRILTEHGQSCETYKTAAAYLQVRDDLVSHYSDGFNTDTVLEENEYEFDKACDELDKEFLYNILEDYRILLSQEYDYLISEAAIIETIEANDYDFTEDGKLY